MVVPAFVCGPPQRDELRSHIAGGRLPAFCESQQASLGGEGEQRDPVGVYLPLGSTHPQQLLLVQQRVDLGRRAERDDEREWRRRNADRSRQVWAKPVWEENDLHDASGVRLHDQVMIPLSVQEVFIQTVL